MGMDTADAMPSVAFTERRITGAGHSGNCREAGAGLPVVILEGLNWGQSRFYAALARQFHVFVLELPAAGATAREDELSALSALTGQLTGGTPYSLIGASQAANLALQIALQDPAEAERIEALILISPTAIRPAPAPPSLTPEQWAGRLLAHPERQPDLAGLLAWFEPPARSGDSGYEPAPPAARLFRPAAGAAQLESRLSQVRCPTLVALGSRDQLVAPEAAALYRSQIPNCHVSLVYDAGHLIAAERPEALSNVVADFVENRETFVVTRQRSVINP